MQNAPAVHLLRLYNLEGIFINCLTYVEHPHPIYMEFFPPSCHCPISVDWDIWLATKLDYILFTSMLQLRKWIYSRSLLTMRWHTQGNMKGCLEKSPKWLAIIVRISFQITFIPLRDTRRLAFHQQSLKSLFRIPLHIWLMRCSIFHKWFYHVIVNIY